MLLVLGGTADGRRLAEFFYQQQIPLLYSVAGLVRVPRVACEVVSGGFSQFGGLPAFIQQRGVRAILDVTHPYAQRMTTAAVNAAAALGLPYWRFHREPWQPQAGDQWQCFSSWEALVPALADFQRILLTCGQLSQPQLDLLDATELEQTRQYWLRTAVQPKVVLPQSIQWIKAIGPFAFEDEQQLFQAHRIDVLVSKNSGGDATSAKLAVARAEGIPVLMLNRPTLPPADIEFTTHLQCQGYVLEALREP